MRGALADPRTQGADYLTLLIDNCGLERTARTQALVARGETYQLLRRYEEALADFHEALDLNPKLPWTLAHRGETYRLMERHTEALGDLTKPSRSNPD
ncbi:tetratricopeptide repeat protein [Streptomyces sp. NPDC086554]|uniref:tetratricopeptide repeat protein n=1 Tax=Streptomyces sp. NPDC086554 TaxID=3154864 RepID=UPI00344ABC21